MIVHINKKSSLPSEPHISAGMPLSKSVRATSLCGRTLKLDQSDHHLTNCWFDLASSEWTSLVHICYLSYVLSMTGYPNLEVCPDCKDHEDFGMYLLYAQTKTYDEHRESFV